MQSAKCKTQSAKIDKMKNEFIILFHVEHNLKDNNIYRPCLENINRKAKRKTLRSCVYKPSQEGM